MDNLLSQLWQNKKFPHSLIIDCLEIDYALQMVEEFARQIMPSSISLMNNPDYRVMQREPNSTGNLAKNIMVGQIRQAENFLAKTAAMSKCKILVIYEADMLNINASNAALKMLEEPPEGCYIILLTNNTANIITTIKSRCYKLKLDTKAATEDTKITEVAGQIKTLMAANNIDDIYKFAADIALKKNMKSWQNFAIYMHNYMRLNSQGFSVNKQISFYEYISNLLQRTERFDLDKRQAVIMIFHKLLAS